MIYTTGTVNTVSGSAIVKGTGTKFKNNNPAINIGMTILIKSGNTNIPYMIKSVNSDTELVLAQPALATATNTTFSIHITEPDNNSDAARTMVAINAYTQYFLDAMNTWMTQTGQTKIEMPNGEVITFDSIKKMQEDIGKKFDKSGGSIHGRVAVKARIGEKLALHDTLSNSANYLSLYSGEPEVRDAFIGFGVNETKTLTIRNDRDNANLLINKGGLAHNGNSVILQGDYGVGSDSLATIPDLGRIQNTGFFKYDGKNTVNLPPNVVEYGNIISLNYSTNIHQSLMFPTYGIERLVLLESYDGKVSHVKFLTSNKYTLDSNGFYKQASPVININPDGTFTTNDESEGATVTRVSQGEYLIEGVLGFNSDAGWGGVDGGIEIPLDVNKQPLIWVNSEVNKDGSILVKTHHRTHPNAPEFANNKIDGYRDGDPIDIPDGRFISVRVQMPEQSIYNVRMREMEEAQKAEEERRQKEEEENQDTNKTP
ncbi:phage tail fiber protein [Proteus sp. G2664]|uniref:phage tail fiber protein n=1 Tax=Proteus sp. G2664 TaxID=2698877 RepID=UPI001377010F|nr:hypothetical protein [Proteus sp. G2664]